MLLGFFPFQAVNFKPRQRGKIAIRVLVDICLITLGLPAFFCAAPKFAFEQRLRVTREPGCRCLRLRACDALPAAFGEEKRHPKQRRVMEFRQLPVEAFLRDQRLHALEHRRRLALRIAHFLYQCCGVEAVRAFGPIGCHLARSGGERNDGTGRRLNFGQPRRRKKIAERIIATGIKNNKLVAHPGVVHGVENLCHRHRIERNRALGCELGIGWNQIILTAILNAVSGVIKHRRRRALHHPGKFHRHTAHGRVVGVGLYHYFESKVA